MEKSHLGRSMKAPRPARRRRDLVALLALGSVFVWMLLSSIGDEVPAVFYF
ncbi:hypothetical protein [Williamsia soli]|uniref:hypothetical protein n=1 Tax=Williamsia soli TaxID=364929 RepID=UPI001A9CE918|nr:hypothetical protein [Williamsia soli]